jgi:tetratricopeptide (TPR) repeat protein
MVEQASHSSSTAAALVAPAQIVRSVALVVGLGLLGCREPTPTPPTSPEPAAARVNTNTKSCGARRVGHDRARELVRCLEGDAALAEYARLLSIDHGDSLAGLGLAQTALEFGFEIQAQRVLDQAVQSDKTHALGARLGQALLAFALYEQHDVEEAFRICERHLQNVLAVDPDNPHAHALAVLLYLLRAQMQDPGSHSPLARAICEEHEGAHAALATSCAEEAWRRGNPGLARTLFVRATRADPDHHGAWMRHGILELEAGNLRSARQYLEQAARSPWPSIRISAHATLGTALDQLGDTAGAIAAYRTARDLCARTNRSVPPDLLYNLGLAASQIGDGEAELAEARTLLEEYLSRGNPSASRKLRVQHALRELELIAAEHERAKR